MRREVLVTGTNSGFGLLTAVHLAGLGFHVVGTVRSADKLDAIESAAAHAGVLPLMRRRGEGRIVNKSSTAAHVTGPMIGWYQVAKRALAAATRALRTEVDGFGVEVVLIEPGSFRTNIWRKAEADLLTRRDGSAYINAYDRALDILHRAEPHIRDARPVAEAIGEALTAGRPRARYRVGNDAFLLDIAGQLLPRRAQDRLLRNALRL